MFLAKLGTCLHFSVKTKLPTSHSVSGLLASIFLNQESPRLHRPADEAERHRHNLTDITTWDCSGQNLSKAL